MVRTVTVSCLGASPGTVGIVVGAVDALIDGGALVCGADEAGAVALADGVGDTGADGAPDC
jgi:hypothetical protein